MPPALLALLFLAYLLPGVVTLVALWLWRARGD